VNIGGNLTGLQLPPHYDYRDIRRTPQETRAWFAANGWDKIVAFQV
jgi:sulfate adenylyltransferase